MSVADYSKGFGGKYGVQSDRQDAVSEITSEHKRRQHLNKDVWAVIFLCSVDLLADQRE